MNMTISIGNSDDKLSQKEYAMFVAAVDAVLAKVDSQLHFRGFSPGDTPWQNAVWLVECTDIAAQVIREELRGLAALFRQDSIFVLSGIGAFIKPEATARWA